SARRGLKHPPPAASGLADVLRRARRPGAPRLVFAVRRAATAERTRSNGIAGKKSLSRQAAGLCARAVLRLQLCRRQGKGEGPMVEAEVAGAVLSRGVFERQRLRSLEYLALGSGQSNSCKTAWAR